MAVTTATVGSEPRRRLVLAAVLVGGVALLVVRPSFGGEPPRAPAPGLADAASLKGLALTTPDAIWWVPRRGPAPTRWQRVSMDTQGMTTLVPLDGLLVAARGRELVVIRTEDGRVERLELPVAAQRDVDATAVLLEDGRMRVAFVADLPPGEPADDGVVSGSGRSGLATTSPSRRTVRAWHGRAPTGSSSAPSMLAVARSASTSPTTGEPTSRSRGPSRAS